MMFNWLFDKKANDEKENEESAKQKKMWKEQYRRYHEEIFNKQLEKFRTKINTMKIMGKDIGNLTFVDNRIKDGVPDKLQDYCKNMGMHCDIDEKLSTVIPGVRSCDKTYIWEYTISLKPNPQTNN